MRPGSAPVIDGLAASAVLGITVAVLAPGTVATLANGILWLSAWALVRGHWLLVAGALALLWGAHVSTSDARHLQSECVDGRTVIVAGRVHGLPRATPVVTRFDVDLVRPLPIPGCPTAGPRRLRVSWYDAPALESGDAWVFEVRLRALRNHSNPGGFDYVAWAMEQGIDAAGTVRRGARAPADVEGGRAMVWGTVHRARAGISDWIASSRVQYGPILAALAVGDARAVADAQWELFRRTGTIHLLVISGLHVAIAASCGLLFGRGVARAVPGLLRRHGDKPCAAAIAAIVTIAYSLLAGFTLPVARACVMTLLGLAWWLSARHVPAYRMLAIVLAVLSIADPPALLDRSLWLSFGATAILVCYFAPRRGLPWSSGWLRVQWVMAAAMTPVLAASVGQLAWISPVANLVAVPLVSLLVVPLLLLALGLASVFSSAGAAVLGVADRLCAALLGLLETLAGAPTASVGALDPVLLAASLLAAAAILMPLRLLDRVCLVPVLLLALYRAPASVPFGEARLWILDVGQGLAVLVDSARHRLLYDAGAVYPSGFDLGAAVVAPAIAVTGPARLDLLVVSHGDIDHRGGVASVRRRIDVRSVLSGAANVPAPPCRRGQAWQWDGVRFFILGPATARESENDSSCVLAIQGGSGRALLPGDIGLDAERRLLGDAAHLPADLLVVPHHGSKTSSSPPFLAAVAPVLAAVSAGYGNRFGHPHAEVVGRYVEAGVSWRNTATAGALSWQSDRPRSLTPWRAAVLRPRAGATRVDE